MIKAGICEWCLDKEGVEAVYRASEMGIFAIQVEIGKPGCESMFSDEVYQQNLLDASQKTGVEIIGIAVNVLNFYGITNPPGSANFDRSWLAIQVAINAAANMGIALVYLPSFRASEISNDIDLERTALVLRDACDYAGERNLIVATENSLSVSGHLKLIEKANHPKLRVLIDSYNPIIWGHKPLELVRDLAPYMCDQFHAKDGINNIRGSATLGTGQAQIAETFAMLNAIGFTGYVILENSYDQNTKSRIASDLEVLEQFFGKLSSRHEKTK